MKTIVSSVFGLIICVQLTALSTTTPMVSSNSLNFIGTTGPPQLPTCLDDLTIQIASNPSKIKYGDTSIVSWSATWPAGCLSISVRLNDKVVASHGSQIITPVRNTKYTITVFYRGIKVDTRSASVTVGYDERVVIDQNTIDPVGVLVGAWQSSPNPTQTIELCNVDLDLTGYTNIVIGEGKSLIAKEECARSPHNLGPRIFVTESLRNQPLFLIQGDNVKISGFRLHGPSFSQQSVNDTGILIASSVNIEISNMEIAGWGGAGIFIEDDTGLGGRKTDGGRITDPDQIKIHNNFFHHNQHPSIGGHAQGYGVDVHDGAWARISENVFDFNRHAISAHPDTGGYIAERNLVLKGGGYQGDFYNRYTHNFDVHGSGCWWDRKAYLCGDAGIRFSFVANTFQYLHGNAIHIRGKPAVHAYIADNVFAHEELEDFWQGGAVHLETSENVEFGPGNITNFDSYGRYGVCDFDGDGIDDLFLATGKTWWYSSYGEFQWTYLSARTEHFDQVRLGYFDNDQRCDVLAQTQGGAEWVISSGGIGEWYSIGAFGAPLSEVAFGQFDPNIRDHRPGVTRRATHAFWRRQDGDWLVTSLSAPAWREVGSSSFPMSKLQFGDFTGDGVTDVLAVQDGRWSISESAISPWKILNPNLADDVRSIYIADLNNNNIDDLIKLEHIVSDGIETFTWWVSDDGRSPWRTLKTYTFPSSASSDIDSVPIFTFVGRFGAAPGAGVLLVDHYRIGHFFSPAEIPTGASPDWTSLFPY